jgi:hypothetical protein
MPSTQKFAFLQHVKTVFDKLKRIAGDPVVYLQVLPAKAIELLRDHPELYHGWFRDGTTPCQPLVDVHDIYRIDMSYGCRGGGSHGKLIVASAAPVLQLDHGGNPLQQLAMAVMERFSGMQQPQQMMFEQMCSPPNGQGRQPHALAALAAPRPSFARRMPTLTWQAELPQTGGPPLDLGLNQQLVVLPPAEVSSQNYGRPPVEEMPLEPTSHAGDNATEDHKFFKPYIKHLCSNNH